MNELTQSKDGYIVFYESGTCALAYGAAEKWFKTYDEAINYALEKVTKNCELFMRAQKNLCAEHILSHVKKFCFGGKITNNLARIKHGTSKRMVHLRQVWRGNKSKANKRI